MNKKLILCGIVAAGMAAGANAQISKVNGAGRLLLEQTAVANGGPMKARAAQEKHVAIVTLQKGADASDLQALGYDISMSVADMVSVVATPDQLREIADLDFVKAVDFGETVSPMMDKGRELSNVDVIHNGTGQGLNGSKFTGKGIAVGLYDTGLDPNHAAFRKADGTSRVKGIFLERYNAAGRAYLTDEEITAFTTDTQNESHGTHVLGIAAGSNCVDGVYANYSGGTSQGAIPFYGVAPDADLIVGCGDFTTQCILDGIAKVVGRAKELGQPAVVNLSLGNNSGSHDDKSSTARWLDALADDAIICISAGNEGDSPIAVKQVFTARRKYLKTFVASQNRPTDGLRYSAEFWSGTDKDFQFSVVVYDKMTGSVVDRLDVGNLNGGSRTISASSSSAIGAQYDNNTMVSVSTAVDANTNRYYAYVSAVVTPKGSPTTLIGYEINGSSGQTIYGYVNTPNGYNKAVFSGQGITDFADGSTDGTINGFGCGKRIVSVGAYVSRTSCPYIGTGSYGGSGKIGDIASFSSYGETGDGRQLPHVCAPGAQIVSSVSTYWVKSAGMDTQKVNASADLFDRNNYYYPMQGTSMSSPFAAGTIALWLEAFPQMTVEQCHEIIKESSKFEPSMSSKRWGAGKIDALAGIVAALKRSASIDNVQSDLSDSNLVIEKISDKEYRITYANANDLKVNIYNLAGGLVAGVSGSDDSINVDASAFEPGIYVVNVSASNAKSVSKKLAVR